MGKKHGAALELVFDKIEQYMKAYGLVREETKHVLSVTNVSTYLRKYNQPLKKNVNVGGPFMRDDDGKLLFDGQGCRIMDMTMIQRMRTLDCEIFWRNLLAFEKIVLDAVLSSGNSGARRRNKRWRSVSEKKKKRRTCVKSLAEVLVRATVVRRNTKKRSVEQQNIV